MTVFKCLWSLFSYLLAKHFTVLSIDPFYISVSLVTHQLAFVVHGKILFWRRYIIDLLDALDNLKVGSLNPERFKYHFVEKLLGFEGGLQVSYPQSMYVSQFLSNLPDFLSSHGFSNSSENLSAGLDILYFPLEEPVHH